MYCFSVSAESLDSLSSDKKSIFKTISSLRISLSTSYILQKNYFQQNESSFLFLNNVDYFCKKSNANNNQTWHFTSDLGYEKFVDSIWTKYSDRWKLNWLLKEISSRRFMHTYSLEIVSQWLDTQREVYHSDKPTTNQWCAGFLNPLAMTFAYNIEISFWGYNHILLGLTSAKLITKPRYDGAKEPVVRYFSKTEHAWILLNYGMSGQVFIYNRKISENIFWDNSSTFF